MAAVLVVGPQRTGTSAVAGILQRLDIDMGVTDDARGREYYECDEMQDICNMTAGEWQHPQTHFFTNQANVAAEKYFERRNAESGLWGVKSPFFALIGHHFIQRFPDLKIVFTERAFEDSLSSLAKREFNMEEQPLRWIQSEAYSAYEVVKKVAILFKVPSITLEYDDVVDNDRKAMSILAAFLGRDITPERLKAVSDFIDPKLRHFPKQPKLRAV